jgi:hypothetical protein
MLLGGGLAGSETAFGMHVAANEYFQEVTFYSPDILDIGGLAVAERTLRC